MTRERANMHRLAEHLHMTVGALLRNATGAEMRSWGMLAQWEHDQKQLAEFRKAQAFNG